jgi:transcriptional regulator with XRE-family HTH domain
MFDISGFLREFRSSRGLSFANFSRDYFDGELSPQTLKNLEIGLGEPRISTLKIVSEKLGVSLHLLAHAAFSLPEPEESGEYEGTLDRICTLAGDLSEERRRQILAFTAFISKEREAASNREQDPVLSTKESSRKAGGKRGKQSQDYIIDELEKLEEDWRKTVEEDNPFA